VQAQVGYAGVAGEVFVESEDGGTVVQGNGGNQGVDGCQREALSASQAKNGCGFAAGGEAAERVRQMADSSLPAICKSAVVRAS
jgi:hypothetical protein